MVALRIDDHRKEDIKSRVDCQRLALDLLGQGKGQGKAIRYRAVWRDDGKHASFVAFKDGFKDFGGNGESFDCFAFIQRLEGLTFAQALDWLAGWLGELPTMTHARPRPVAQPIKHDDPPSARWQTVITTILDNAQQALWSPAGAEYLTWLRGRGLADATIIANRIGYNPTWINTGLFDEDHKPIKIGPGLLIPCFEGGALWYVKLRTDSGDVKYIQVKGGHKAEALYQADTLRPGLPVWIVESELDALLIQQEAGDLVCPVATGGTSGHVPERYRAMVGAAPLNILNHDNDDAGRDYAQRNGARLPDGYRPVAVPAGKDVTEYAVEYGGDLRAWITDVLASPPELQLRLVSPNKHNVDNVNIIKALPFSVERNLNDFASKHAPALLTLLRAILEYAGDTFALPALAIASGTNYRLLHRAMTYGGSKLCEAAPAEANVRSAHIDPLSSSCNTEETMCSSDICSSLPGKTVYYRLRENWIDLLLTDVLRIGIVEKVTRRLLSPRFSRATVEHYRAIWAKDERPYELTAVDEVNARLLSEIPQDIQQAVDEEMIRVRRELSDRSGGPLPHLWKTDYRAALAARDLKPHIDTARPRYKTTAATGLSPAAQRSAEGRIGIKREAQYHPEGQLVEKIADLPDLVWSPKFQGFPERATFDDGKTLDYRKSRNRTEITARIGRGERARIDYNQASIIREMTPEERAAQTAKPANDLATSEFSEVESVAPTAEERAAQSEQAAEQAYQAAVEAVKWQLHYLGYRSSNGATYDRDGEQIADRAISDLPGSTLIAIARGKYQRAELPDILTRYDVPTETVIPTQRLYNAYIRAKYRGDGDAFLAALDSGPRAALIAFSQDEEAPKTVFIGGQAA